MPQVANSKSAAAPSRYMNGPLQPTHAAYMLKHTRFHDHALHITLDNSYHGLAGFLLMSDKVKDGSCGSPFNLEVLPVGLLLLTVQHWKTPVLCRAQP